MSYLDMIIEKRKSIWNEQKSMLDTAVAQKRELTPTEQSQYEERDGALKEMAARIEAMKVSDAQRAKTDETLRSLADSPKTLPGSRVEVRYDRALPPGATLRDLPGAIRGDEAQRSIHAELGQYIRDLAEHRAPQGADEQRGQNMGTGTAGGFLVPTPISTSILSATVARCRTVEAGASIVPMSEATLKIPRVDALPSLTWRAESGTVPESTATFGSVTFTANTAACMVRVSMELMEDVEAFGAVIENALSQSAAVEIDRVGLYGLGASNQPNGLKNQLVTAGRTTSLGANGGALTYASLIAAKAAVKGRGYTPTATLLSTRTEAALGGLMDTTNQFVLPPAYLSDVKPLGAPGLPTNLAVGSSNATADAFVGDFGFLAYGLRTALSLRVLDQLYATTGEIGIMAWLRLDVQCLRPDAFQAVTGATN